MSLEERYDEVRQLIEIGKEKGYLLSAEMNELLPLDITTPDELDELFTALGNAGIEVVDSEQKHRENSRRDPHSERSDDGELDLTPSAIDKTNDPVRMYLRQMGTVPLLTREGEVEIAQRIERGKLSIIKAISRTPTIAKAVVRMSEQLTSGDRTIRKLVIFQADEVTDARIDRRTTCGDGADRDDPEDPSGRGAPREGGRDDPQVREAALSALLPQSAASPGYAVPADPWHRLHRAGEAASRRRRQGDHGGRTAHPARDRARRPPGESHDPPADHGLDRRDLLPVFDEIAEMAVLILPDRRLERDRLLGELARLLYRSHREVQSRRDLLRRWFAAQLLHERGRRPDQLVDRLDHVNRDPNRPGLVGDRAGDRLADPPGGVSRELIASHLDGNVTQKIPLNDVDQLSSR